MRGVFMACIYKTLVCSGASQQLVLRSMYILLVIHLMNLAQIVLILLCLTTKCAAADREYNVLYTHI